MAFVRLLSLLDRAFGESSLETEQNRERLARHFVQRRRVDITSREWGEERAFPRHETAERPYELTPAHCWLRRWRSCLSQASLEIRAHFQVAVSASAEKAVVCVTC